MHILRGVKRSCAPQYSKGEQQQLSRVVSSSIKGTYFENRIEKQEAVLVNKAASPLNRRVSIKAGGPNRDQRQRQQGRNQKKIERNHGFVAQD